MDGGKNKQTIWYLDQRGLLAADPDVYRLSETTSAPRSVPKIAFYARRHTERRAVELGLLALEWLARNGGQFYVEFFGMKLHIGDLPYPFTDNGVLNESELVNCIIGVTLEWCSRQPTIRWCHRK